MSLNLTVIIFKVQQSFETFLNFPKTSFSSKSVPWPALAAISSVRFSAILFTKWNIPLSLPEVKMGEKADLTTFHSSPFMFDIWFIHNWKAKKEKNKKTYQSYHQSWKLAWVGTDLDNYVGDYQTSRHWAFWSDIGENFVGLQLSYSDLGLDTISIFKAISISDEPNIGAVRCPKTTDPDTDNSKVRISVESLTISDIMSDLAPFSRISEVSIPSSGHMPFITDIRLSAHEWKLVSKAYFIFYFNL